MHNYVAVLTAERGLDHIRSRMNIASASTHYRKHFLGPLIGTFQDNWLGYENS